MAAGRIRPWLSVSLLIFFALAAGVLASYEMTIRLMRDKVLSTLGPHSRIKDIRLKWDAIDLYDVRIRGEKDRPADAFRVDLLTLSPSVLSAFSRQYRISSIDMEHPFLSIVRTREKKIVILPGLMKKKEKDSDHPHPAIIDRINLQDGAMEFFDDSAGETPLIIRFEKLNGMVKNIVLPEKSSKSTFAIKGIVRGTQKDGNMEISGWARFATKDSSVAVSLRSVDLTTLQPYLIKANEAGVEAGTLDLDLKTDVRNRQLKAKGTLTLSNLKLSHSVNPLGTFMGVPRNLLLKFIKTKGDKIILHFDMEGDISNPRFSLNETLRQKLALSLADFLKIGIGGVAKGVGTAGAKGTEAVGGILKGIGSILQGIFGGDQSKK